MQAAALLLHAAIAGLAGGDSIPHYTVNLNLAPEARWRHVIDAHRQEARLTIRWWHKELERADQTRVQEWLRVLDVSEEHVSELRGMVDAAGAPPATLNGLILLQFMYELNYPTFCTGIIAAMPNGTVVHGRNMDFWGDSHSIQVTFEKNGQALYSVITKPGYNVAHTGMRFGAWSVALNRREPGSMGFVDNLAAAKQAGRSTGFLLRQALEDIPDFATALDRLSNTKYMAPNYLTLAGTQPYEGALITANRFAEGEPTSTVMRLDATGQWFLVQTNEDSSDEPHSTRFKWALNLVANSGQDRMTPDAVLDVLRTPPYVLNYMTQFTWVVVPATGSITVVKASKEYFVKHFADSALVGSHAKRKSSLRGEPLEVDPMQAYWVSILGEDPLVVSNPSLGWQSPGA